MEPTIQHGDYLLVERLSLYRGQIKKLVYFFPLLFLVGILLLQDSPVSLVPAATSLSAYGRLVVKL